MKSGLAAHETAFARLTGILADVAKDGARQRRVIRNWATGAECWLEPRFCSK
jgi:hypothetical protein